MEDNSKITQEKSNAAASGLLAGVILGVAGAAAVILSDKDNQKKARTYFDSLQKRGSNIWQAVKKTAVDEEVTQKVLPQEKHKVNEEEKKVS